MAPPSIRGEGASVFLLSKYHLKLGGGRGGEAEQEKFEDLIESRLFMIISLKHFHAFKKIKSHLSYLYFK